ncbi:MAG: T9SS type A sorting domain-containing protein, partial [Bacteroidia bacterium]|nr:T9SS type A sorting domain-containing protein [Bacteroidia bacterium]
LGTADDVVYIDTTDSNGGYLFTDLPMGDYQVMVLDGTGTPLDGLNNTTGGNTTNTALTPGAPIDLTQDFGYYLPVGGPLVCSTTGSVITCGTNTGTVTVNVTGGVPPYNYFWNTNPPQTTQTATNLPAGTYLVQVTDQTGSSSSIFCFATITCSNAKNSSAISNDENNDWSIMVYPNPTDGAINLNYFADEEQRIVVEFRDMTGRVVHAVNETATLGANQHRYDLSSLPKGIYFIIVQNKDARKVERIVLH